MDKDRIAGSAKEIKGAVNNNPVVVERTRRKAVHTW